jgi:predicted acylesterase/phospholipase RssA
MHIWEACRATSAAITFFDPIVVNGTTYSDGGLLYNNPVQLLHGEASEIFQDREQRIISLGTGIARSKKFDPAMLSIAKALAKIATETELTANDFHRRNDCEAAQAGRYFRFNVPGIGDISMEEAEKLNDITNLTEAYLEQAEISKKALLCARKLAGGTYMGKDTTKSESLHVEGQKADGNPELSLLERMHRLKSPNGV